MITFDNAVLCGVMSGLSKSGYRWLHADED